MLFIEGCCGGGRIRYVGGILRGGQLPYVGAIVREADFFMSGLL